MLPLQLAESWRFFIFEFYFINVFSLSAIHFEILDFLT